MIKNRLMVLALILGFCSGGSFGEQTLENLNFPKSPAYRLGVSAIPENQYVEANQDFTKPDDVISKIDDTYEDSTDVSYADLDIKRISKEIARELSYDEQEMVSDLSLLWQGAATQSDTINFALYKLANPDADKPDKQSLKNVLKTIASMSTLVGASVANPMIAGSSFIGGNILNIMSQDTKSLNYKYTKVNDADMIILIRKVEDLQQNTVNLYYDYMSARKQVELTNKLVQDRQNRFELAQQNNAARELVVITDAYYRSALDKQRSARSEFLSKRAALEQFVGNETFNQFEQELLARENGDKDTVSSQTFPKTASAGRPDVQEPSYEETIQNVENYISNSNSNKSQISSETGYASQTQNPFNYEDSENNQPPVLRTSSVNTSYEYEDMSNDPNLSKLPELQPLEPVKNTIEQSKTEIEPLQNKETKNKISKPKKEKKVKEKIKKSTEKMDSANSQSVENLPVEKSEKKIKETKKKDKVKNDSTSKKTVKTDDIHTVQPRKVYPKNSTKDLIFLHGQTPGEYKLNKTVNQNNTLPSSKNGQNDVQTSVSQPKQTPQQQMNQKYNLMPLDEIKAPHNGYSIYSESTY